MDIHPPMKKMESLKEYAAHILIVTIGILIALGLEGIRESWREHAAVREAKSSFHEELQRNQQQLNLDIESIKKTNQQLDGVIAHLDVFTAKPEALKAQIEGLTPGFYFYSTSEWESATSSSVLPHMRPEQRKRYIDAYLSTRNYQEFSKLSFLSYEELVVYVASHHSYNDADKVILGEKLRDLRFKLGVLTHLGGEMQDGLNDALQVH